MDRRCVRFLGTFIDCRLVRMSICTGLGWQINDTNLAVFHGDLSVWDVAGLIAMVCALKPRVNSTVMGTS